MFILALTAKATPLILPVVLFWLVIQERQGTEGVRTVLRYAARTVLPFFAVSIVYVVVLKLATYQAFPDKGLPFNLRNIFLAFCTLFIPEERLNNWSINLVAPAVFLAVSALGVAAFRIGFTVRVRRTGYCILLLALLPVLFTTDFKLATADQDPYLLMNSPSHRIYLASVGAALIGAGLLSSIETLLRKFLPGFAKLVVVLLLGGVVAADVSVVRERDSLWQIIGDGYRLQVQGLLPYRDHIPEGCQVGMINFTGSSGFQSPMARVVFNVNDLTNLNPVQISMIGDMDILRKAEVTFLFVYTREGQVLDKTQQFRQMLLLNRMALLNQQQPQYQLECRDVAARLNDEVHELIGR